MKKNRWMVILALTTFFATAHMGCDDSTDNTSDVTDDTADFSSDSEVDEPAEEQFVITTQIFSPDGATTLIYVVESLTDIETLEQSEGFEFPGYSSSATYDGKLFVAPSGTANVERYTVANDGVLELDDTISFQNYGFQPGDGGFLVDASKAYMLGNIPEHVIFNSNSLEITGDFTIDAVPEKEEFPTIRASTNGMMDAGNYLRTFFWQNSDDVDFSDETVMAMVDPETDEVTATAEEDRCPVLNKMTKDEDGTVYFSTWLYSATSHLLFDAPQTCILRKDAGAEDFDQDWQLNFADITDGREGGQLFYIGDDKAIATVFHDERADVEGAESPYSLAGTANWGYWLVDLEEESAEQIESVPYSAGDPRFIEDDGTFYLFIPSADYSETTAYEVTAAGESEELFTVSGWIAAVEKLGN